MKALVIAEKPSVAMALASVLGARTRKDGYVEGNGYIVSWCVGHLVGLCDASEYDEKYKKWRYEDLPIVPECWKHKILEGTKKQFGILKKLMRDSKVDEVICATDAGREGELIFRLVYEQAGCKKPMKRLWISSMEEQAIKDGFASLKDGSCYDSLYQSALCRAKADWLVGINASRLFSVLYNQNLKVGRVQTPTLAMIVDRNQKIKEFTKEKYYMAHIKFDDMDAVTEHFQKKEDADKVAADCAERMCEVEKDDVKEKTVRPPKLYDLTTLQREANRMFGYTAQQTLDAVQEMYEQKLVTYPRTDSQYLTDEMGESTETLIQMLLGKMPYAEGLEYQPDVSKVLNSKKVSDHHAIIPTVEVAKADIGKLKERNCKILYLISARVLTATAGPYIYESHKCQITCNYHTFYLSAKKTKQEGFKSIENKLKQFFGVKSEKEEPELDIWDGKHYGPCDSFVSEHFTQPPKQYTEDTLLSAMERAGNALYKRKESILCAMLRFLMDRGIFVNENQVYTFKEIKERINTLPENEEILRRWLKVLNSYGFIKEEANGFTALLKITEHFFETIWSQMEELWNGKLCNKLANEYLLKNIKALSELFSGEINPTHILFPEGKFDYAEALYKDTFIFQYLNTKIAQKIKEFLDATEHIEILELGAGTGATTDNVLPLIKERKNVIYYFSDISYVFLREAQHKYSEFRNIKYMTLNVNNLDLGKKVDIIIANGVLNNAKNIKYTLDKMLEITSEKGKIFIIEQVEESLEMLVSQVFMMKDSSALEEKGGKTFRNTEEWLRLLRDDRIEKIEVFPEKYNIDQRLFILYHK